MEEQFIPYEEALVLKELGFDELCLARFDGGGFKMLAVYDPLKNSEIKEHWFCVTPLYQQAFKWFREKYELDSWVSKLSKNNYRWHINDDFAYYQTKTYEDTELACLKKLIEIVKNK